MNYQEFIIKDGLDGQPPRIGQIVESSPNSPEFVVVWNDNGERENVRTSGKIVRAREGSFTYLLKTSPSAISELLNSDPVALLKAVLVDNNFSAKSNKEITDALVTRGKLDDAAVSEMWKITKPQLLALEGVSTQGTGGNVKYRIARPTRSEIIEPAIPVEEVVEIEHVPATDVVEPELSSSSEVTSEDSLVVETGNKLPEIEREVQQAEVKSTALVADAIEEQLPVSAVYFLGGLLGIHDPSDSQNILSSGVVVDYVVATINKEAVAKELSSKVINAPLTAGILLEDLSNKLISGIAKKLTKPQIGPIHAAALSRSRQTISLLPGFQDWLNSPQSIKALVSATNEFASAPESPSLAQREALANAYSRVLEVQPDCVIPASAVLSALTNSLLASSEREVVTKNLADRFVKTVKESTKLPFDEDSLLALGLALANKSFTEGSTRSSILAALGHFQPELIDSSIWWRGLDFESLELQATSPLGALLSKEPFASDIVAPLVRAELSSVTTRKGLAKLFSAPAFALEFVTPADIESLMSRVAKSDRNAQAWLDELSKSSQVVSLEQKLDITRKELDEMRSQKFDLSNQIQQLESKIALLQSQIDQGRSEQGSLSAREKRQISIDAYRDLARVAATIEREAGKLSTEQLLGKIQGLLTRSSITQCGKVGEQIPFDPRLHMSPGGRPENGALVTVLAHGYQWFDGQEEVVLVESLVSAEAN